MRFWESQKLSYVIGFARNSRLQASIDLFVEKVMAEFHRTQEVQRQFTERLYQADTWDRPRRMIGKVGVTDLRLNRRFVVTHLTPTLLIQTRRPVPTPKMILGFREKSETKIKVLHNAG